ncbi:protein-arginine N5-methyltransferase SCDLUD_004911 [Saccharomycodes ludwigii]|uniref:protein-arginine N5-methyltransferase n=1 Tax=Saccharomycodes ludwigii TaxID=36035 RepID=UPI001E8672CF|nr:hypothetical protein SCDLUD_004911 [Saccharomycodes ludwigii]KAH3899467.1 hypothetical protein SCDLUD_004911 [Saccharomycodes ludwigii]
MSELHELLTLPKLPITKDYYIKTLQYYLSNGIPATYTLENVIEYNNTDTGRTLNLTTNTTPLHTLSRSISLLSNGYNTDYLKDGMLNIDTVDDQQATKLKMYPVTKRLSSGYEFNEEECQTILDIINLLFEYGAGWNFLDFENKTIGNLIYNEGIGSVTAVAASANNTILLNNIYLRFVEAGIATELLFRKVEEVEWIEEKEEKEIEREEEEEEEEKTAAATEEQMNKNTNNLDIQEQNPADNQSVFLETPLEYTDSSLITKNNKDGVMMDWESDIMHIAAETVLSSAYQEDNDKECINVLNIGFGMGIIDAFIENICASNNDKKKYRHYICEAHPDVIARFENDPIWSKNPNIILLKGRWQDTLNTILDQGDIFFDGIYYDTFSEHYNQDMLNDLYDVVVGLLKPKGVFSFFNGLGADNPFFYDVYKEIVVLDLQNYGLTCEYKLIKLDSSAENCKKNNGDIVWDGVKQSYFNCKYYYHPKISFM